MVDCLDECPNDPNKDSPGFCGCGISEVDSDGAMWGKDGFSFADLLDVVNPLQHIPVIGQIYRGIASANKS